MRLISAALAVFILSATIAGAQDRTGILPEGPPKPDQRNSGGANLGSSQLMARVESSGALDQTKSKGAFCSETAGCYRGSTGNYRVRFARDVTGCTAVAVTTFGEYVSINHSAEFPDSFLVFTFAAGGTLANSGFMMQVMC